MSENISLTVGESGLITNKPYEITDPCSEASDIVSAPSVHLSQLKALKSPCRSNDHQKKKIPTLLYSLISDLLINKFIKNSKIAISALQNRVLSVIFAYFNCIYGVVLQDTQVFS